MPVLELYTSCVSEGALLPKLASIESNVHVSFDWLSVFGGGSFCLLNISMSSEYLMNLLFNLYCSGMGTVVSFNCSSVSLGSLFENLQYKFSCLLLLSLIHI